MNKNFGKNVSSNYSQKLRNDAKQSATDAFKTISKRGIQKTTEMIKVLIKLQKFQEVHH